MLQNRGVAIIINAGGVARDLEQEAWSDEFVLEVSCGQGTQTSSSRDEHDKRDECNIPAALFEVERNDDTRSLDSGGSIAGV